MTPELLNALVGNPNVAPFVQSAMQGTETAAKLVMQNLAVDPEVKRFNNTLGGSHRQIRDNGLPTDKGTPVPGDVFLAPRSEYPIAGLTDEQPGRPHVGFNMYDLILRQLNGSDKTNAFLPTTSPRGARQFTPEHAQQIANPNNEFI
jgi:hypothetical protein